jgi:sensor histidine kinase YesM
MGNQWYTKKWVATSLHVLFWILFFVSPYLMRPVMDNDAPAGPPRKDQGFFFLHFLKNVFLLLLFYGNAYLFIPKFVYRRKFAHYLLLLLLALFAMLIWDRFFFNLLIKEREYKIWNFFVFNLFPFFFILISSTAYRMIRDRIEENQRNNDKETENLKTELLFLRSQVSPHFMFNVLNNMVALARKGSDQLEPSLIKLSSLIRYMLYETKDKVPLQKEIEYLQSYIDLQQQRFGRKLMIHVCMNNIDASYEIEPMLLVPFVENAFKHGTGLVDNAEINIELSATEKKLTFLVRNRFNPDAADTKDADSGIGLPNVQRRLNLLYGQDHSLQINKHDNWFSVSLQLNLH